MEPAPPDRLFGAWVSVEAALSPERPALLLLGSEAATRTAAFGRRSERKTYFPPFFLMELRYPMPIFTELRHLGYRREVVKESSEPSITVVSYFSRALK